MGSFADSAPLIIHCTATDHNTLRHHSALTCVPENLGSILKHSLAGTNHSQQKTDPSRLLVPPTCVSTPRASLQLGALKYAHARAAEDAALRSGAHDTARRKWPWNGTMLRCGLHSVLSNRLVTPNGGVAYLLLRSCNAVLVLMAVSNFDTDRTHHYSALHSAITFRSGATPRKNTNQWSELAWPQHQV